MSKFLICFILFFASFLPTFSESIRLDFGCDKGLSCKTQPWKLTRGFHSDYLNKNFQPGTNWIVVESFPIRVKNHFKEKENLGTYTFFTTFNITKDFLSKNQIPGILLGSIGEVFTIYINGNKIAEEGEIENGRIKFHRFRRKPVWPIKPEYLRTGENTLVIKLSGNPNYTGTGFLYKEKYEIGNYNDLTYEVRDRVGLVFMSLYLLVGLYHLLLYQKRRNEKYNLFFAFATISISFYNYLNTPIISESEIDTSLVERLNFITLYMTLPFLYYFQEYLFFGKSSKYSNIYSLFCGLLILATILAPLHIMESILTVWRFAALLFGVPLLLTIYFKAIKQKNKDAKMLAIGFLFFIASAIFDLLDSMYFGFGLKATRYGFFAFIMGIAGILADRFLNLYKTIERLNLDLQDKIELIQDLNTGLERKVEERTKELQNTLTQVQSLKLQQDGDYFLTTLLIEPLMVNEAVSKKIKIDFFIKQKKSFVFKDKTYELGGDICIANNINLRGKNYCVFINGDAMGKSIQGAGGALVLGVVFRSIIERSKTFKQNMDLLPERWLKICFIELQNVFVSFDGSMLVSIVMGLVEENTGSLYFINAEHPWTVLYRDKKASFLENQFYLHKVGMLGVDGNLVIQTFQMEPNDTIIIGSDGRDDIMLGMDDEGQRDINDDSENFLRHVEEGGGELQGITNAILQLGEFTDDYTLIKISYPGDENSSEETNPEFDRIVENGNLLLSENKASEAMEEFRKALEFKKSKDVFQKILNFYYSQKNFKKFIPVCEEYLNLFPLDSDYYFKISYALKFEGEFLRAADYGECFKLRRPDNVNNLLNLTDIYRKMGNPARANKLLSDALVIDPKNLKAVELQKKLNFSYFRN